MVIDDSMLPKGIRRWDQRSNPQADYSASELRRLAKGSDEVNQSRRLLSLAANGMNRKDAARIGGMDRQTLRVRISESRDSDSANSRTAVSLMSGQFGGDGPRLPGCRYG